MASLNKILLIGRLGKNGELRYLASGTALCEFSVATDHFFKKDEEWQRETEWHDVKLFGDAAHHLAQYLTKGKQVYVEGRLQTRSWDDDKGQKHYRTEVVASTVQLLDKREDAAPGVSGRGGQQAASRGRSRVEDLPFE